MFLTLERYWAIKKPLQYDQDKVRARLPFIFTMAWVIGLLSLWPTFGTARAIDGGCRLYYDLTSPILFKLMTPYYCTIAMIIPATVMMYSYISIGLSLSKSQQFGKDQSNAKLQVTSNKLKKAQINLLQTCVLLMILFVLCWMCVTINFMLFTFEILNLYGTFYHVGMFFVILNSCLNPLIYSARYSEFQNQIKVLLGIKQKD